ncbi:hypothetical protein [Perigonia lusca single nucleopolyhedrovirus]|uniref:Uncharacterized protein n=1 Tax=Perigonia lusca single nucleopolyhedrovirus TaxID=1675865 RepID=A0A0M3N1Y6_9ABAC|nr:hypothetical protein [Perigonia lusca single nucleopolyhedrovirus]AKN80594.1 hypothetical protein [Perigonia lusca single nucleopolyhedrovirus]
MKTTNDISVALVFVWYHDEGKPVYNTVAYPFWHNIQYHSETYKCFVLQHLGKKNNGDDDNKIPMNTTNNTNITVLKFSDWFDATPLATLNHKSNKIDYMKMCVVVETDMVKCFSTFDYILLMDMDCVVRSMSLAKMKFKRRRIEPFFDMSVSMLHEPKSYYNNSFDSYLENYAVLVDLRMPRLPFTLNQLMDSRLDISKWQNSAFFKLYTDTVCSYYSQIHTYLFPFLSKDLQFDGSVSMDFHRGGSWKSKCRLHDECEYVYDYRREPVFHAESPLQTLYKIVIRSGGKYVNDKCELNDDNIINTLIDMKLKNYDFTRSFTWSNSEQKNTNVCGFLIDRCFEKHVKFTQCAFVEPVKYFDDDSDDD